MGKLYRNRYVKDGYFRAIELLKVVAVCFDCHFFIDSLFLTLQQEKHNLRLTQIALRWMQHHSTLTPEDGVIIGASSAGQLKQNCVDSQEGPLPQEVLDALDEAAQLVGNDAPTYWR